MGLNEALAALRAHLEHLRELGVREVDASPERLAALKSLVRNATATAPTRATTRIDSLPGLDPPQPSIGPATESLEAIASEIAACKKCRLCEARTRVVPGQGRLQPDILFVGEGPGEEEDRQGLAFVGRAGQLLTRMIEAMGYTRDDVFIGNIVKCRPPGNRTPLPDEMAACLPFLERQIAVIRPKLIVALGSTALKGLFGDASLSISRVRGTWMDYRGIPVMPTYHPAYLLRNPDAKREVWEDLKAVLQRLGRPLPRQSRRGAE
ncbi:MAG: uracil-DNA glycosylase [Kiritimatiellae bacterium]|nr:uracil-DNA glycosylase [Kiritimatiellia bacterium]MDW8457664.1 uracil-DNA glycosylase [Verrucomicrobiota bacterium]